MEGIAAYVIPLIAFVAIFALLMRRAKRRAADGRGPEPQPFWPVHTRWIAVILGCATIAFIISALD
jgi:hypothetical protein